MIIDSLPAVQSANDNDEIALEVGQLVYKITKEEFLSNYLRFDASQELTPTQKAIVRAVIDAAQNGVVPAGAVRYDIQQTLTPEEQTYGRQNLGIDSSSGGWEPPATARGHNNIFRGKYLGRTMTSNQLTAINDGTFDDLYIGDYWGEASESRPYLASAIIVGFDYYYGIGYYGGGSGAANQQIDHKHHAVVLMNYYDSYGADHDLYTNETTTSGYANSRVQTFFNDATQFTSPGEVFGDNIIPFKIPLSSSASGGVVTNIANVNCRAALMNEYMRWGHRELSSLIDNVEELEQFPFFKLNTRMSPLRGGAPYDPYLGGTMILRDIYSDSSYVAVGGSSSNLTRPITRSAIQTSSGICYLCVGTPST